MKNKLYIATGFATLFVIALTEMFEPEQNLFWYIVLVILGILIFSPLFPDKWWPPPLRENKGPTEKDLAEKKFVKAQLEEIEFKKTERKKHIAKAEQKIVSLQPFLYLYLQVIVIKNRE
ncbi:MAG: hypothetical protein OXI44_11775 [Bacteroidota bacterium]|nr:hypothetical protein [Bacteroidota bacterium]